MEYTIKQAAARLQVSTKTVSRRIADGQLKAYKLGARIVRISESDLDAYIEAHKAAA